MAIIDDDVIKGIFETKGYELPLVAHKKQVLIEIGKLIGSILFFLLISCGMFLYICYRDFPSEMTRPILSLLTSVSLGAVLLIGVHKLVLLVKDYLSKSWSVTRDNFLDINITIKEEEPMEVVTTKQGIHLKIGGKVDLVSFQEDWYYYKKRQLYPDKYGIYKTALILVFCYLQSKPACCMKN